MKKNFLLLAILIGVAGVVMGSITIFSFLEDLLSP